jgi:SET domain-containing protein
MKHIYICNSKIEGKGVFVGEDVERGEDIQPIKGELKFKVNKNKKDALAHPNWIGVSENIWIDPDKPFKFLNHSCNPSAGIRGKKTIVALREIKEGEEVTIDYSIIEGDPRWELNCLCGEDNCRKKISSIHTLPVKQFKKYLPFIPNYFKNVYLKLIK